MKKHLILIAFMTAIVCSCNKNDTDMKVTKDFLELAADRYSVRSFSDVPVDQTVIDKIIEAGNLAPTAVNSQPQKIYVIKSQEAMKILETQTSCVYGAPHAFLFCYNDDTVCKRGEYDNYGDIDVSIVLTHMMLEAANLGIGTCPVGMFDQKEIAEAFELPSNIHPVLLMPFGYPADDAAPSAMHTKYRPLEETIEYL